MEVFQQGMFGGVESRATFYDDTGTTREERNLSPERLKQNVPVLEKFRKMVQRAVLFRNRA